MNDLTLFAQGLVPVYKTDTGEYIVNGRELWESLQSKQDFSTWVKKRLSECDAFENEDFDRFHKKMEANNATMIEYMIKLDTAKEMAMLEHNEIGKQVRKYFIAIEKKSKQNAPAISSLSPQLQLLINIELQQKQQQQAIEDMGKRIEGIKEVVALNPNDWRKDTATLINKMALKSGGYEHIKPIREESYELLNKRFGVALSIRLTNKKKTLSLNGVCKSKIDKCNYLDVITDDKKLIEGYIAIVKEMAIKYGAYKEDGQAS